MATASELDTGLLGLTISALGLTGEAGEFADHVKKHLAQGHALDATVLDKEAGDMLWYLARYATWRGTTLGHIARLNLAKLKARYGEKFTPEASQTRAADDV